MIGEDAEGYWRAFIRMSYNMIKTLKENGENKLANIYRSGKVRLYDNCSRN